MRVVATLQARGHEIDDCDLYVESIDPIMSEQERVKYHDPTINKPRVAALANRFLRRTLLFSYPVWNEGFLAILKGLFRSRLHPRGEH